MPLIFLTIRGIKYAVKKYKEHEAKKALQERGIPFEIHDPSHELHPTAAELPNTYQYPHAYHNTDKQTHSQHPLSRPRSTSSSSSSRRPSQDHPTNPFLDPETQIPDLLIPITDSTDITAMLHSDPEYAAFMRQQQHLYLQAQAQKRASSTGSSSDRSGSPGADEQGLPPSYAATVVSGMPPRYGDVRRR